MSNISLKMWADFIHEISLLGRQDVFAVFKEKNGKVIYQPVHRELCREDLASHMNSNQPIGIYPMLGNQVRFGVFDIDNKGGEIAFEELCERVQPVINYLMEKECKPFICRSGGGNGLHIWLFWDDLQSANDVRQFMRSILKTAGFNEGTKGLSKNDIEIYPKQKVVNQNQLGNLIALPLARASIPLDASFEEIDIQRTTPNYLDNLMLDNVPIMPRKKSNKKRLKKNDSSTLETLSEALKFIPADDYSTWINFAHALKYDYPDEGFELWDCWSKTSIGKYDSEAENKSKWDNLKPTGQVTCGSIFYHARKHGWRPENESYIDEYNARYAILTRGNKTQIIEKYSDSEEADHTSFLSKNTFLDRHIADRLYVEDGGVIQKAKKWFENPDAERFNDLIFDPSKPSGANGPVWNMWSGFGIQPMLGDWRRFQDHIFENIAQGDVQMFEWFMNWMAYSVQHPSVPIGTAPILIGDPGTGKGFVANQYGQLWGKHTIEVTHRNHVAGNFNQHLLGRRFVLIDEGMFSGDKRDAQLIKTRITESHTMFEAKGIDPIRMPNRMIFMVASNENSVVAADRKDRRWTMFHVGNGKRENQGYFKAIDKQMKTGGLAGMFFDLLQRDISKGPNPTRNIRTAKLFDQIIHAQDAGVRYLYSLLNRGAMPSIDGHSNLNEATIEAMWREMKDQQSNAQYVPKETLGRMLTNIFEDKIAKDTNGRFERQISESKYETHKSTLYRFPALHEARGIFEAFLGVEVPWDADIPDWTDQFGVDGKEA